MYRVKKSIDIDFSHHVRGHGGACINLHGHTWKFEVVVGAETLDKTGFVVDFGQLKAEVLSPCHRLLDHALAIGEATLDDAEGPLAALGAQLLSTQAKPAPAPDQLELAGARNIYPGGMKVALFPFAPTSERLARWLYELAADRLDDARVRTLQAVVYETLHPVQSVASYGPVA